MRFGRPIKLEHHPNLQPKKPGFMRYIPICATLPHAWKVSLDAIQNTLHIAKNTLIRLAVSQYLESILHTPHPIRSNCKNCEFLHRNTSHSGTCDRQTHINGERSFDGLFQSCPFLRKIHLISKEIDYC